VVEGAGTPVLPVLISNLGIVLRYRDQLESS